jgi:hypothetical protein
VGRIFVKGWRAKFIFLFIVYFAGFATAIYMLAPPPENQVNQSNGSAHLQFDSEKFVKSFNSGMHKCVDLGKEAAQRTAEYIKEKVKERQTQADS